MVIFAFLALVLIAASVALVASAVVRPGLRRSENLEQIALYGYGAVAADERPRRALRKSLDDLAGAIGSFSAGRIKSLREDEVQKRLLAAGFFGIGARRFNGYRVLLTIVVPLLTIWILGFAGASTGVIVFLTLLAGIIAWIGPSVVLTRRTRSRLNAIDHGLPELIDLLVVTLEAGVAFAAALQIAADRLHGPLGEEVRLTIQEQTLGLSMMEALENWLGRTDTPSVRSFCRSMIQGDQLGVSIGQILRNLAVEMRARRKQLIEERAQKTPIKILFPLVFLIFPAMFLVILGPMFFRISEVFN
jgi:tight adherence protein C